VIERQTGTRANTRARWMKAAERAVHEGVQLRQLAGSGQWIARSGSDDAVAYEVEVTGTVAHGCGCLAGLNGDPVCKHRAAFSLVIGVITRTPKPDLPALGAGADCPDCNGCGVHSSRELERRGLLYPTCRTCDGTGILPVPALRPAA
jgi:hypothetical protein